MLALLGLDAADLHFLRWRAGGPGRPKGQAVAGAGAAGRLPNYATKNKISDKQDPKNLIRNTCRSIGILTQFIDYEEQQAKKDVVIEKVVNTVKDMLSAAGFMESFISL